VTLPLLQRVVGEQVEDDEMDRRHRVLETILRDINRIQEELGKAMLAEMETIEK
jgi:hypothetical protein